ncbi:hypothetical protein [Methylobacterium sp. WL93]|nr:hypothetical protein [Methylobacterium sp. WL93]
MKVPTASKLPTFGAVSGLPPLASTIARVTVKPRTQAAVVP